MASKSGNDDPESRDKRTVRPFGFLFLIIDKRRLVTRVLNPTGATPRYLRPVPFKAKILLLAPSLPHSAGHHSRVRPLAMSFVSPPFRESGGPPGCPSERVRNLIGISHLNLPSHVTILLGHACRPPSSRWFLPPLPCGHFRHSQHRPSASHSLRCLSRHSMPPDQRFSRTSQHEPLGLLRTHRSSGHHLEHSGPRCVPM